jgi:hypothetical protein
MAESTSAGNPAHTHRTEVTTFHRHRVTIPGHNHGMSHTHSIGAHVHGVTIPAHTHSVTVPAHTHGFSIPQHTHDTLHGIYQGGMATSATLRVDGRNAGHVGQGQDINLVPHLSKDNNGRIRRGTWHTVEIIPNSLTRVEADIMMQIYVQSHGGGDF